MLGADVRSVLLDDFKPEMSEWQHWYYSASQCNISLFHWLSHGLEQLSCVDWHWQGIRSQLRQEEIIQTTSNEKPLSWMNIFFERRQNSEISQQSWDGDDTHEDVWLRVLNQIISWSVKLHFSSLMNDRFHSVFSALPTCSIYIYWTERTSQRCWDCKMDLCSI